MAYLSKLNIVAQSWFCAVSSVVLVKPDCESRRFLLYQWEESKNKLLSCFSTLLQTHKVRKFPTDKQKIKI